MMPGNYLTPTRNMMNLMDAFRLLPTRTRIFDDPITMFRPFLPVEESLPFTAWTPAVDIFETEKALVLKMELPGIKKEDVHVTIENNMLTVRGERKMEEQVERENYHRMERTYGEFVRSFSLPPFVDGKEIKADFAEGLLRVTLPKVETARPKEIEVKVK